MGIVTRTVFADLLRVAGMAVLALSLLLTVGMAAKEGIRQGLPGEVILWTMPYFFLEILGYVIPGAMLFAVCAVYGRMSGTLELVALKSLGVNPVWTFVPAFVLAYLASLLTTVTYDMAACWGRPGIRRVVSQSVADIATGMLRAERSFDSPWFSIVVSDVSDQTLINPAVRMPNDRGEDVLLTADTAELIPSREGLVLRCTNSEAELKGTSAVLPGETEMVFPLDVQVSPVHRDWLALRDLGTHAEEARRNAAELKKQLRRTDQPQKQEELKEEIEKQEFIAKRLSAEPHRRWANGFSCLCFAMIGAPVAALRRNSDVMTTFFAVFLPILLCFYPLLMLSENLALSGTVPVWAFWLCDAVLLSAGIVLTRHAIRH